MEKHKINDEVFFVYENKIHKGIVGETKTITKSIWGIQLHNDKGKDTERKFETEYIIILDSFNKKITDWLSENRLFTTLDALMKSLISNLN